MKMDNLLNGKIILLLYKEQVNQLKDYLKNQKEIKKKKLKKKNQIMVKRHILNMMIKNKNYNHYSII
jgi:hypothetical protein